ncbi:hypothetical protein SAMN05660297_00387 [Natronincola peptidivorans]|uniref:YtxH-like protein n=1 Tax=Natronincola peptidivorans TaxID=426128 RepID=A0A1H9YSM9_9FIRM|nr:hypothetical protein [Natronincola peptidivorans]SES72154.1 hypothetical protein SAMN05660297_00387 [Natronincola peptidivorans]
MKKETMVGLITGSLLGATVGMYAVSNMSPKEQKKMMKRGRKMITTAAHMMSGMNMF